MSRFLYWTIVLGTEPTSFRAADAGELLPTLSQLRRKHPDASLRWFQRGRLWLSPEEAKAALSRERSDARGRPATWRPGGTHEDPRQKYIDAKKAKWTRFKSAIRERAEARRDARGEREDRPRVERPRDEQLPDERARDERTRDERPIDPPPAERTSPKPDAPVPAERPARRDWRIQTETGDAPRLIKKPGYRRPQPEEPDPPVRARKPFDRERAAFDGERKPAVDRERNPFDRDRKPPFRRDGDGGPRPDWREGGSGARALDRGDRPPRKPAFDRDRPPAFDRERKPFDRDRKPAFDRERKPFDRDRKPAFDRERKPFDRERTPAFDRERKPFDRERRPAVDRAGGERPPRKPAFDGDRRPPFAREGGERPPRKPAFDRDRGPQRSFDRDRKPGGPPRGRTGDGERGDSRPPGAGPLADWRPKPSGDRPRGSWGGGKPGGERRGPGGFGKPFGDRTPGGDRPRGKGPGAFGPGGRGPAGRGPNGPRGPRKPKP